ITGVLRYVLPFPRSRARADSDVLPPVRPRGTRRTPAAGRLVDGASGRMMISAVPLLGFRSKLPMKVSPARKRIVSPGTAASIAGWRLVYMHPLAHTVRVAP